jgi:hypothetical protein
MTTGLCGLKTVAMTIFINNNRHGVWVPAFAGTTLDRIP